MLSRITGMVRDMVLAFCFGTHEALAALFVAFRLSQVCRRLFGEGALQSAFIPVFEELRSDLPTRAFKFFRDLTCMMSLLLVGFILLSMLGLFASFSFIDWSEGNQQIVKLMIILMPSLLFVCLFGLNSSLLQCQKRYFTVGIAPTFFNVCVASGSLLFIGVDPNDAVPYIALFIVLGCLFQWLATMIPTYTHVKNHLTTALYSEITLLSPDIRRLGGPLALGLLGVGATQINNNVDALFSRYADPEGPAQLWYALRLIQLPLALFGIAISGALLPPLSRSIQAGRKEEYLHFLDYAFRRVFTLLLPCTLALYVLGIPIINLLFGRGDFQIHSIVTTCMCLHGYAIGLLPMGLIIVLAPAFYAYKDLKTPARGAFICLGLNFIINCIFVFGLGFKSLSVTLATSISAWFNVWYLYNRLHKHFGQVIAPESRRTLTKLTIATLITALLTWLFQAAFYTAPSLFTLFVDMQIGISQHLINQIGAFLVPALFFTGLLLLFCWITKCDDLLYLLKLKKE